MFVGVFECLWVLLSTEKIKKIILLFMMKKLMRSNLF